MDQKEINKQIFERLGKLEIRLSALGKPNTNQNVSLNPGNRKQLTLREIVKGRKFKNGQEQIVVIVGYYEKILSTPIHEDKIQEEWVNSKMTNKYNSIFIERAKTKDKLIRIHSDKSYDLTQAGEEFFEKFLKNESTESTSK